MSSYRPGDIDDRRGPRYHHHRDDDRRRDGRFDHDSRRRFDGNPALDRPLGDAPIAARGRGKGRYEGRVGSFRQQQQQQQGGRRYPDDDREGSYRPPQQQHRQRSRSPPAGYRGGADGRRRDSFEGSSRCTGDSSSSYDRQSSLSRYDAQASTSSTTASAGHRRSRSPPPSSSSRAAAGPNFQHHSIDVEMQEEPGTPADLEPGERLDSPVPIAPISVSIRGSAKASNSSTGNSNGDARPVVLRTTSVAKSGSGSASVSASESERRRERPSAEPAPAAIDDMRVAGDAAAVVRQSGRPADADAIRNTKGVWDRDTSSSSSRRSAQDASLAARREPGERPSAPAGSAATATGERINPLFRKPDGSVQQPESMRERERERDSGRERGSYDRPRPTAASVSERRHDEEHSRDQRDGERGRWDGQREPPSAERWERAAARPKSGQSWHRDSRGRDEDDGKGLGSATRGAHREAESRATGDMDWTNTSVPARPAAEEWGGHSPGPTHGAAAAKPYQKSSSAQQQSTANPWNDNDGVKPAAASAPAAAGDDDAWVGLAATKTASPAGNGGSTIVAASNSTTKPASPVKDAWSDYDPAPAPVPPAAAASGSSPAWANSSSSITTDSKDAAGANSPARYLSATSSRQPPPQGASPSASSAPAYRGPSATAAADSSSTSRPPSPAQSSRDPAPSSAAAAAPAGPWAAAAAAGPSSTAAKAAWLNHPLIAADRAEKQAEQAAESKRKTDEIKEMNAQLEREKVPEWFWAGRRAKMREAKEAEEARNKRSETDKVDDEVRRASFSFP